MANPRNSPPIDGWDALIRELADLRRRVSALENRAGRSMAIGTGYRIQASGTGGAEVLQAYRIADGNTVQIAP